jgi:putative ABC transport system permease protein
VTTWFGAIRTATGGLLRHKMQAVVIGMVLLISTASATLGLALLAAGNAPFLHGFAAQRGAHVTVTVNSARASAAQLAATGRLAGVTASAGPFAQTTAQTQFNGQPWGQLLLAGRSAPGGNVDDLVLTAGHWVDAPGQVVLEGSPGSVEQFGGPQVGSTLTLTGVPGTPSLTVVGFANSITNTADGWVTPAEIARLRGPGDPASVQLLYRFASAGAGAQIRADIAEVTRALPPGTVTGAGSWLVAENSATGNAAIMEPFVVAFALIGLAMAVLHQSANAYSVGSQHVPWWASVLAPAGMLALTVLAAFGPALRAGRLSATQAIAAGRAPGAGRGYAAHRLAARLRLPRPVGLGLAAPFARPARTVVTLAAQPGTAHDVAWYTNNVRVTGIAGGVDAWAFGGDTSWLGFGIVTGRWYDAPGQVDVNTSFLDDSGLAVGDTATVDTGSRQVTVRIAGEVFQPSKEPRMYGSATTLPGVAAAENLQGWYVGLRPGTSLSGYLQSVNRALGGGDPWQATRPDTGKFYTIATGLIDLLAVMVAIAAGLGVLNTVLMSTRDRVHDLGVFKALGMRPGQMLTMVTCWIVGPAVVAGAIAAPAAIALNTATLHAMAGTAHTGVPASFTDVFPPSRLALLSLAALLIAVAGALPPAGWAARARPAVALRAE